MRLCAPQHLAVVGGINHDRSCPPVPSRRAFAASAPFRCRCPRYARCIPSNPCGRPRPLPPTPLRPTDSTVFGRNCKSPAGYFFINSGGASRKGGCGGFHERTSIQGRARLRLDEIDGVVGHVGRVISGRPQLLAGNGIEGRRAALMAVGAVPGAPFLESVARFAFRFQRKPFRAPRVKMPFADISGAVPACWKASPSENSDCRSG